MQIVSGVSGRGAIAAVLLSGDSPVIVDYGNWCEVWSSNCLETDELADLLGCDPLDDRVLEEAPHASCFYEPDATAKQVARTIRDHLGY